MRLSPFDSRPADDRWTATPEPGEPGDEQAAREWADEEAAKVGYIWLRRFPGGRDW